MGDTHFMNPAYNNPMFGNPCGVHNPTHSTWAYIHHGSAGVPRWGQFGQPPNPYFTNPQHQNIWQYRDPNEPSLYDAVTSLYKCGSEAYAEYSKRKAVQDAETNGTSLPYNPETFWKDLPKAKAAQLLHVEVIHHDRVVQCSVTGTELVADALQRELKLRSHRGLKIHFTNGSGKETSISLLSYNHKISISLFSNTVSTMFKNV